MKLLAIKFEDSAEQDLDGIYEFIAAENPAAALRFVTSLRERITLLGDYPELGRLRPEVKPGVRSFAFGICSVYYSWDEKRIVILHVARAGRDTSTLFPIPADSA